MLRADFAWLNFDEKFNRSNQEATRSFVIDDEPERASRSNSDRSAEGFLLIQARNVGDPDGDLSDDGDVALHRILINGRHLPSFDLVEHEGWNLWMDRIPAGFLREGTNRLTIRRRPGDSFQVANVVVQWRESEDAGNVSIDRVLTAADA